MMLQEALPGVLHIGDELSWRGGENQIRLFTIHSKRLRNFVAYPQESEAVKSGRFDVPVLPLASKSPLDPRNVTRLIQFVDTHKIKILAAQSSKAHSLALILKRFRPHLKLIVHRRVDNKPGKSYLGRRKYLSPLNDRFVAVSELVRQSLIQSGVDSKKIDRIYDGIEIQISSEAERQKQREIYLHHVQQLLKSSSGCMDRGLTHGNKPLMIIGNASALNSQKGYEYLLEAMGLAKDAQLPWLCLIAGVGEQEAELKSLSEQMGLTDSVFFLGFVQPVRPFLEALDVMALTSRNEGLGSTLLDGALAGAVLVGSQVGGIPEIILDGETGLLTQPKNGEDVFHKLKFLYDHPHERARLSEAAQKRVTSVFSIQTIVEQTEDIYLKAIL